MDNKKASSISREWVYSEYINREALTVHAPFEKEMDFYSAVRSGNTQKVNDYLTREFSATEGLGALSDNPLRNMKYHFIITAAMLARSCIEAGLPLEPAYSLSDFYINKADKAADLSTLDDLHDRMVRAYTGLMQKRQSVAVYSKPVVKCINYIYSHLHTRITMTVLADETGLSAGYLSRLFKKETGQTVSAYVEFLKIETAGNMLRYSDYSPGEIAMIMGFPSQSYFTERFRKQTGTTPGKYSRTQSV